MSPVVPRVLRTPDSADFFDAAGRGALLLRRCVDCGTARGPQEPVCPHCHATDHTPEHASGRAVLVSWAEVHRAPLPALDAEVPYLAALVEVSEGPWLLVRVLTAPGEQLGVGTPLRIRVMDAAGEDGEPLVLAATEEALRGS